MSLLSTVCLYRVVIATVAYILRKVPSLESTYPGDVQEGWDILEVGDRKEETVKAENPQLQTWPGFCLVFLPQT